MFKSMAKNENITSVVVLILVSALAYLPLIGQVGYLNDDWYLMYSAGAYGPDAFTSIFSVDRPARAFVMSLAYNMFGGNVLYYNLSAYAFRVISALAFFLLLNILWPKRSHSALIASLLYLVYPGFLSQMNGIDYQSQMVSLAAVMLSILLSVKAALSDRVGIKVVLFSFSILVGWLYLGLVEYFLGFELFRLLCVLLLFHHKEPSSKDRLLKGLRNWLPNVLTPMVFLIWRIFFFVGDRTATDLDFQFENVRLYPVQMMYHWSVQVIKDLFDVLFAAWAVPLSQLTGFLNTGRILLVLVLSGVILCILYLLQRDDEPYSLPTDFFREAILLGFIVAAGGLIPIVMVNREVYFPSFSRYSLVSSVGVALIVSAVLSKITHRVLRNGFIGLLVFISVLTHQANTAWAAQQTSSTRGFWWQVSWRIPQLEKNATLIASYPNTPLEEDYFIWGPANLIYYPEKVNPKGIQPGIFAALVSQDTVDKVHAFERQEYKKRKTIVTYANYRNILVITQPSERSCVRVIDGFHPEYSNGEWNLIRELEPYSEIEHVLADETPHTPPNLVFGPEPSHGWCYYYQKADLARQRGEWDKVLAIGEQAFGQGFEPKDLIEWMPFLQAYAVNGDVERLHELSPVINKDPFIAQQACQILGSMTGLSTEVIETVESLYCQ